MNGITGIKTRVVARTKFVRQTSPGVWQSFNGPMYTDLYCEVKNQSCVNFDVLQGSGWNSWSSEQTVHRTAGTEAHWSQVTSNHMYSENSVNQATKTIVMSPCN